MRYPESLLKLTRALSRLPGIGPKTAQRLALHLAFHKEEAEALAEALEGLKAALAGTPREEEALKLVEPLEAKVRAAAPKEEVEPLVQALEDLLR